MKHSRTLNEIHILILAMYTENKPSAEYAQGLKGK
jgi:hypothetical protein